MRCVLLRCYPGASDVITPTTTTPPVPVPATTFEVAATAANVSAVLANEKFMMEGP